MAIKIYCEQGALTQALRRLRESGSVEIVAGDESPPAVLPTSEIRDLNLVRSEPPGALADYSGSTHFETILMTLGFTRRREALHVDLAWSNGCRAFVTQDPDILRRRSRLEELLGMRCFHPARDEAELLRFIADSAPGSGRP
jgi:hypothetical protein